MRNNPSLRTVDFNCCDLEAPFHILAAPCLGTSSIEKFQVTSNKSRLRSDGLDEVERWYAVCDPLNIGATWSSNYSLAEIIGGLQRELGQDVQRLAQLPTALAREKILRCHFAGGDCSLRRSNGQGGVSAPAFLDCKARHMRLVGGLSGCPLPLGPGTSLYCQPSKRSCRFVC